MPDDHARVEAEPAAESSSGSESERSSPDSIASPGPVADATAREALLERFRERHGLRDLPLEDLDLAFMHRSRACEEGGVPDNERLEFLGDAVLGLVASAHLFETVAGDEGDLSKIRAALVSRDWLGRRARAMGLGPLLQLGVGEARAGGADRSSVLGCALEALAGAVHRRLGYERARDFALAHVVLPLFEEFRRDPWGGDAKSALQELTQRLLGALPEYRVLGESGPDHEKVFRVEVRVGERVLAEGAGRRIRHAETDAARSALAFLSAERRAEE